MAYADIDAGKVLNKEGLLELSNQIKSYVDANAGGGNSQPLMPGNYAGLLPTNTSKTKQEIIDKLLAGEVVFAPPNYTRISATELSNHTKIGVIGPFSVNTGLVSYSSSTEITLSSGYYYYYIPGKRSSYSSYDVGGYLFVSNTGMFAQEQPYMNADIVQTKTPMYLELQIKGLNKRIPLAPTTDGDYVLKVSVSSGTPTYSWVSAT